MRRLLLQIGLWTLVSLAMLTCVWLHEDPVEEPYVRVPCQHCQSLGLCPAEDGCECPEGQVRETIMHCAPMPCTEVGCPEGYTCYRLKDRGVEVCMKDGGWR